MRGWSQDCMTILNLKTVLPAHAGVILVRTMADWPLHQYYPHMRGWSTQIQFFMMRKWVLPAHAGVILSVNVMSRSYLKYYPHMRGWSSNSSTKNNSETVLPAHAGVILLPGLVISVGIGITRTCGGDPTLSGNLQSLRAYYPHMRGWSWSWNFNWW